ncbi:hypothetical protein PV11_00946 [Exophiala sideris]|uniref:Uncharacterized protein n=1 Tax=Exophiala sideris TaxID=1016849 RepID=A0A0D1ZEI7_9EURO|nr:hypothetical protein PV11_00946 [Exophiala sideris]
MRWDGQGYGTKQHRQLSSAVSARERRILSFVWVSNGKAAMRLFTAPKKVYMALGGSDRDWVLLFMFHFQCSMNHSYILPSSAHFRTEVFSFRVSEAERVHRPNARSGTWLFSAFPDVSLVYPGTIMHPFEMGKNMIHIKYCRIVHRMAYTHV